MQSSGRAQRALKRIVVSCVPGAGVKDQGLEYRAGSLWVGCPTCNGPVNITPEVQRAINDLITILWDALEKLDEKALKAALDRVALWCTRTFSRIRRTTSSSGPCATRSRRPRLRANERRRRRNGMPYGVEGSIPSVHPHAPQPGHPAVGHRRAFTLDDARASGFFGHTRGPT